MWQSQRSVRTRFRLKRIGLFIYWCCCMKLETLELWSIRKERLRYDSQSSEHINKSIRERGNVECSVDSKFIERIARILQFSFELSSLMNLNMYLRFWTRLRFINITITNRFHTIAIILSKTMPLYNGRGRPQYRDFIQNLPIDRRFIFQKKCSDRKNILTIFSHRFIFLNRQKR